MTKIQDEIVNSHIRVLEAQLNQLKTVLESTRTAPKGHKVIPLRMVLERIGSISDDVSTLWNDIILSFPEEIDRIKRS